ncbi:MAG TPA: GNAT family N-acetyltransferase [Burkholderiaceae bacterium]|nr:GNAT family N-acetyltransferase [Burkholderiaceae bacterium]
MSIEIRDLALGDFEQLRGVYEEIVKEGKYFYEDEAAPPLEMLVFKFVTQRQLKVPQIGAFIGDRLVGWVEMTRYDQPSIRHNGTLVNVGVAKDYRGQGIGRRLIEEALARAWNAEFLRVELFVIETNVNAIRLYESLGFKESGRLRHMLCRNGQFSDRVMMDIFHPRTDDIIKARTA